MPTENYDFQVDLIPFISLLGDIFLCDSKWKLLLLTDLNTLYLTLKVR